MKSITELNLGCGKKEAHECVSYYKSKVDNVETYHTTCQPNQLCEECEMRIEVIGDVLKLIDEDLDTMSKRKCSDNLKFSIEFGKGVLEGLKRQLVNDMSNVHNTNEVEDAK